MDNILLVFVDYYFTGDCVGMYGLHTQSSLQSMQRITREVKSIQMGVLTEELVMNFIDPKCSVHYAM